MKLIKLKLNNFLSYKKEELDFADLSGLVLIRGENRDHSYSYDSNGCGKTSILDAICWCLYGQTSRGAKGDALINRDAKKNCYVQLRLTNKDDTHSITRYRNHSEYKNAIVIEFNGSTVTGIDQQSWINSLIGCDSNTFTNIFFFYQTAVKFFAELSDRHQKEILSELLNLSLLDRLHEDSKDLVKECDELNSDFTSELIGVNNKIVIRESDITELIQLQENYESEKTKQLDKLSSEQRSTQREFKSFDKKTKLELDNLISDYEEIEKHTSEYEKTFTSLVSEVEKLQTAIEDLIAPIKETELIVSNTKTNIQNINKEIKKVNDFGPKCPSCLQKIDDKYKEKRLSKLEKELFYLRDSRDEKIRILQELKTKHKELNDKISGEKLERNDTKTLLDNSARDKGKLNSKVTDFDKATDKQKQEMRNTLNNIAKRIEEITNEKNPYVAQTENKTKELEKFKIEQQELQGQQEYILTLKLHREYLQLLTSNSGAKSRILTNIVPFLNTQAAKYSEKFTDGSITIEFNTITHLKSGEYRDKFNVQLYDKGKATDYANFSGGERRRINICILLALRKLAMLSIPSNKRLELAIYDETFDHLDDVGYIRALELLQEEYDNSNDLCLLVSHNPHMERNIKHEIRIIKENGESKAKVI